MDRWARRHVLVDKDHQDEDTHFTQSLEHGNAPAQRNEDDDGESKRGTSRHF